MTRDELLPTMIAMTKYGGSFASKLADAMLHADSDNLQRIVNAFPEMIERYKEFAGMDVVKKELEFKFKN